MPSIEVRGLAKRFGEVRAVDDLTFEVRPGGVTGFLGPNGAGKTTTLRILLGLVSATSGQALVNGKPYRALPDPTKTVGAVLEASGFHPARTARNHLQVIATVAGVSFNRVDEVLDLVGLGDARNRRVGGFSMGMRQRLEFARALLGMPEILILDEPANGLDPQGIAWLRGFLKWYASEGRIVLVSSHLLAEAQLTVEDVLIISGGRLRASGRLQTLLAGGKQTVRVRTPDAERLVTALAAAGMTGRRDDGAVVVEGATPEAVGPVMAEHRIVVHEMTSSSESLEELFFSLTEGADAYSARPVQPMGEFAVAAGSPPAPAAAPPAPGAAPPPAAPFPDGGGQR